MVSTVFWGIVVVSASLISRKAAYVCGCAWARGLLWSAGISVHARGLENIDPNGKYVFVSNHQSHLDILALLCVVKAHLTFIAKRELFYVPFFGWSIAVLGHIAIDRSSARKARASLDTAVRRLQDENISVVIFPEGTRSRTGEVSDFKRGSFSLAIESGLEVIPVSIDGTFRVLRKGSLWIHPGTATVTFGAPLDMTGLTATDKDALSSRVRELIVAMKAPAMATPPG
jgi:1-acyl-sn-glycerol-3-phosphate acyltransferase